MRGAHSSCSDKFLKDNHRILGCPLETSLSLQNLTNFEAVPYDVR
jgi:hypothetical protein